MAATFGLASAVPNTLVGLLVDVSGSMTSSIQSRHANQTRLESFRDALEEFARDYSNRFETMGAESRGAVKVFAYGFGFGNPLTSFLGRSGLPVRDLLALSQNDSTVDLVDLAKSWAQYKSHVESLTFEMFGSTPMLEGLEVAKQRFFKETQQRPFLKILFVLSDGEPTDSTSDQVENVADEIRQMGVLIVSCYVTSDDVAEPRHLYADPSPDWPIGAKLMHSCASVVPNNSPFEAYLSEFNWRIDQGGRLFTQINQSELLAEFMNLMLSPFEVNSQTGRVPTPADKNITLPITKPVPESTNPLLASPPDSPGSAQHDDVRSDHRSSQGNWAAWVFGGVLVVFFMGIIWFKPQVQFNPQQDKLLRILSSVLVGVVSAFFTGNLRLEGKVPLLKDTQIGTIGGFAGFALTFFLW